MGLIHLLARPGAGLLLDLDGTLLDSEPVHRGAFRDYFSARGWTVSDEVIRQFAGRRAQEVFPVVAGPWAGEDPESLTAAVLDVLRRSGRRPVPVAGAVRLLAACARAELPVAIVTSARREWAAAALELLGAAVPMVTAEDCARGKPDPEPFRRGADLLGLPPGGLVAAEDSPAGIASGRHAGIGHVLGVTTSADAGALRRAGAHETAPDLTALALAVEALMVRDGSGA
ncbi:HAD family hydrolase [Pengzhenrongella frigida]|uniref:HAD family hydrolase n=1 Tax=Pengzhenrongella frigida TaxID=1259133 RepID=UPI0013EA924F|nr:HAD-IA family hydrolase [Cellulomonas sp. HLT2-17]